MTKEEKNLPPFPFKKVVVLIWERIPKAFFWTLISSMIVGALTLSYAFVKTTANVNRTVPQYQAQTTQIQAAVTALTVGQAEIKRDVDNADKNFTKLQESVDKSFENLNARLDRLFDKTEEINKNTK